MDISFSVKYLYCLMHFFQTRKKTSRRLQKATVTDDYAFSSCGTTCGFVRRTKAHKITQGQLINKYCHIVLEHKGEIVAYAKQLNNKNELPKMATRKKKKKKKRYSGTTECSLHVGGYHLLEPHKNKSLYAIQEPL